MSTLLLVRAASLACLLTAGVTPLLQAQQDAPPTSPAGPHPVDPGAGRGGGGFGQPPFGMGQRTELKLRKKFDADKDGILNAEERKAAVEYLSAERAAGRLGRGPGGRPGGLGGPGNGGGGPDGQPRREGANPGPTDGPGGPGGAGFPGGGGFFGNRGPQVPAKPGRALHPGEVRQFPNVPLYEPTSLRTFFFQFENGDWEKELAAFHDTDVEVPADLTVDGKSYPSVGVGMRGMSSFMMVGEGRKRSLSVALDLKNEEQKLGGYHSLHLLNSHEDPTFLRSVLFDQIAREYLPAPKCNLVRVVVNGECWGIYVNQESFTKEFIKDWFGSKKGVRWKVPGNPGARGGLEYIGENVDDYRKRFEIKSKDEPEAWRRLIHLCKVLNETPPEQLEAAISPIMEVDEVLRFLALDNVLINGDGYWTRSSDYGLYEDEAGSFHMIPHDTNETFSLPGNGPGGPGGPGRGGRGPGGDRGPGNGTPAGATGGPGIAAGAAPANGPGSGPGNGPGFPGFGGPRVKGVELDPLVAAEDARKPLLSKLLAVPSLRARYLAYVQEIAEKWLDWARLGPVVAQYRALIAEDVSLDTRKLESEESFASGTAAEPTPAADAGGAQPREISLRDFADRRREYLRSFFAAQPVNAAVATPQESR